MNSDNILGILFILVGICFFMYTLQRKGDNHLSRYYNTKGFLASIILVAIGIFYLLGAM